MDLERLTKHQIVLLTLLVSFVTSIATGIVTVSLMDQAPVGVTRVVNQIVEHTVETVVPTKSEPAAVAAATVEKTVVIKEDDLAAKSIASVQQSIIRIVEKDADTLIARGVVIDASGTAITDRMALTASGARKFEAILPSGERTPITVLPAETKAAPIAIISLATTTGLMPVVLADASKLVLGQSVIRIGGLGQDTVASGVIAMLPSGAGSTITEVQASVSSATPGSVLTTLFGEVIGIATSGAQSADLYMIPLRTSSQTI